MFFDGDGDENDVFIAMNNPELYHIVSRELYALGSQLDSHYSRSRVPTHTEDGIPIRKLYVSNLPLKTTRTELFGVFAQYGFIKSCWLRMEDKGPNKGPTATYAFVTYSNPADAHKALEAPSHEKTLHGRILRISPADSWHQPAQDADGRVRWRPRQRRDQATASSEPSTAPTESTLEHDDVAPETSNVDNPESAVPEETEETPQDVEESYNILDILNRDCLTHILNYIPITDLIRSERVSKRWQSMVQDYLQSMRTFKTSWWTSSSGRGGLALTTAVLRRVLARAGGALLRLHIDNYRCALNDRTAHTVGKFCPNLDELKVVGMQTKNWNPLVYGCKQLRVLSFISCNKLTDTSLVQLVKKDSCIESLTVANNTHVTGLFLTGSNPPKLNSLAFYNCYSLQGTVLCAAIDTLKHLTTLKLDCCPISMWKIIPYILNKLPRLMELSLSEYASVDFLSQQNNDFADSIANLTELRILNLFKNVYVTNAVLKQVAQTCMKLESLNISSCNSRKNYTGVSDEGVVAVCSSCRALARLDVSYLAALTDAGLRALPRLPRLAALVARGNPALSAAPFSAALATCHTLQEVDLCGCDGVSEEVAEAGLRALQVRPRALVLRLAATAAAAAEELPSHKLLSINIEDDLSNPNLRPDFVDNTFEDSSEDSFYDLYDEENFDEFFRGADMYFPHSDDEYMDDDELNNEDYEGLFAYGIHGQDIILLQ